MGGISNCILSRISQVARVGSEELIYLLCVQGSSIIAILTSSGQEQLEPILP